MQQTITPAGATDNNAATRALSKVEIALLERINQLGDEVYALVNEVRELHMSDIRRDRESIDGGTGLKELSRIVEQGQHWRMRAVDDLQAGFMKLRRSVTRPTHF